MSNKLIEAAVHYISQTHKTLAESAAQAKKQRAADRAKADYHDVAGEGGSSSEHGSGYGKGRSHAEVGNHHHTFEDAEFDAHVAKHGNTHLTVQVSHDDDRKGGFRAIEKGVLGPIKSRNLMANIKRENPHATPEQHQKFHDDVMKWDETDRKKNPLKYTGHSE